MSSARIASQNKHHHYEESDDKEVKLTTKKIRNPRSRLFSDSTDELPKSILKNARIPTKRSVSECVDDISHIMAGLDLDIGDLHARKFCPHHNLDDVDEIEDSHSSEDDSKKSVNKCDCEYNDYNELDSSKEKPKKSVHFDDRVYQAVYIASRLYDRKSMAKYHSSTRHHPSPNSNKNSQKKSKNHCHSTKCSEGDDGSNKHKLTKSQRARQSKRDKRKKYSSQRKDDSNENSSDDQGYCSSLHSNSEWSYP